MGRCSSHHPYDAVTDESGRFELTDVPAGEYELVTPHEGWNRTGKQATHDVLRQRTVERPLFGKPRTWQVHVSVSARQTAKTISCCRKTKVPSLEKQLRLANCVREIVQEQGRLGTIDYTMIA
jgi:hypothetical protein